MTLSKRKSRIITVDDQKFRWAISGDSGFMVFVAELATAKGKKIEVVMSLYITEDTTPMTTTTLLRVIKPGEARTLIQQAIYQGWDPTSKGGPAQFSFQAGVLNKR